jgi:hypothetical protein
MNGLARFGLVACALVGAVACRSGSRVSTDPAAPIYRAADARFAGLSGIVIHYVSVTTSNGEGVDLVKEAFTESLQSNLSPRFGSVAPGAAAPAGGGVLEVSLTVNWGSRAARAIVGFGAGRAGIVIQYDLKDASGKHLAKLHVTDSMAGGFYGGNAKELAFSAASKWSKYFADAVVVDAPAQ